MIEKLNKPVPIPEDWGGQINELETFFKTTQYPATIQMNQSINILNVKGFIDSSLIVVKEQNGIKTFKPYLNRLIQLKELLTDGIIKQ
jgi:hypothetical protein